MKRNSVKALILGAAAGILCVISPDGHYNNTPVAIYQHPLNITVFYLIYFAVQADIILRTAVYDIRFKTVEEAKLRGFLRATVLALIYTAAYFICSCAVSYVLSKKSAELFLDPFRCGLFLVTAVLNFAVLNVFFVNLNYLMRKTAVFFVEAGIILCGLALCFAAPTVVPYVCVWYYGVYPKFVISPVTAAQVYLIWAGVAVLLGLIPQKDILRKERQ